MSTTLGIELVEVGPRDGLQNLSTILPTAVKKAWISRAAAAGLREIEVGSFVPARLFPQFTDVEEVVAHALQIAGLTVCALVPNVKGAQRAIACGVHKLSFTLSVSPAHSLANVRKSPQEQLAEFRRIVALRSDAGKPLLAAGLSTAFGCSIAGAVAEADVCRLAVELVAAGADEVTLADTVGYANPAQVRRLVAAVRREIGAKLTALHLHDTRGAGLANALAGLDSGIRSFDASLGGLGGCPYAPGASGNICLEDLVFMLEAMGLRTGIDIESLLQLRGELAAALPSIPFHGALHVAGLPKNWPSHTESEP